MSPSHIDADHELRNRGRIIVGALPMVAWLVLIAVLTLTPDSESAALGRTLDPFCILCGERGTADMLLNVVLFAPLGAALAGRTDLLSAILAGIALSIGLEAVQTVIPGRFPTLGDVVSNGLGTTAGVLLKRSWPTLKDLPRAHRVALAALGALLTLTPAVLFAPAPTTSPYFAQLAPSLPSPAAYRGRVTAASIGGRPARRGRQVRSDELRAALARGAPVDVTFILTAPPDRLSPVFRIVDAGTQEIVSVGISGRDLVWWERSRATALKLGTPSVVWWDALAGFESGRQVRAIITKEKGSYVCMRVDDRSGCGLTRPLREGWQLLLTPTPRRSLPRTLLGVLWLAIPWFLLGLAMRGAPAGWLAPIVAGVAVLLVSLVSPWLAPSWGDCACAAGGAAVGVVRRPRRLILLAFCLAAATGPVAVGAQSVVTGEIEGRIQDPSGLPVAGALVTLRSPADAEGRITSSSTEGDFSFPYLAPGRYELLAEALGKRPVFVSSVLVPPGRPVSVRIDLADATPPIETRDTIQHSGTPAATGASIAWMDPDVIGQLPDRADDLAFLTSLGGRADEHLGLDGLPDRLTTVFVDGQRFQPAHLPGSEGDGGLGMLLPGAAIRHGAIFGGTSDIEWSAPGGVVAVSTGVERKAIPDLFGLWAGDATWKGSGLGSAAPPFTSLWGGGGATFTLVPDTAFLHVALETARLNRPLAALLSDSVADLLMPGGDEADAPLARAGLEELETTAGSARLTWSLGDRGNVQAGFGGSVFDRSRPDRPAPDPGYLGESPVVRGTDGYASANVFLDLADPLALEIRAGGGLSRRDFTDEAGSGGGPASLFVDPAIRLGMAPGTGGEVRRNELGASAAVHVRTGPHRLKAGARGRVAAHRFQGLSVDPGLFLFPDAASAAGRGIFVDTEGGAGAVSFIVPTVGAFLQYRWTVGRNLLVTVGANYDFSRLPFEDVSPDTLWFGLTGLANNLLPERIGLPGGRLHAIWDLTGSNQTVIEAGVGLDYGEVDPAAVYELIQNSGRVAVRHVDGVLSTWPSAPAASEGTRAQSLTLPGPGFLPPRTTRGVLGFAQRLREATTVRFTLIARRTERLIRRADLNVPTVQLTSPEGRAVLAPLATSGNLVRAVSPWRRFPEYDAVWALNTDGWSRYTGLTAGFEQGLPAGGTVFASYTFSSTRDNLVGLRQADPGARLAPGISGDGSAPWEEGTSDLDVPHRASVGAVVRISGPVAATLSGIYRFRSALPFTPMVRRGLDVNGDGSSSNDVAFVPESDQATELGAAWDCLAESIGEFPERNSCRGDPRSDVDLRLALGPIRLGTVSMDVVMDVLNLTDQEDVRPDDALLLLDPTAVQSNGVTVPLRVNPAFGTPSLRMDRGRLIRLGFRMGAR